MNPYLGHPSQLSFVEEHRLIGAGKGDGMRLYQVSNGRGLDLTVSPDRNGDITRLRYRGVNLSYLSPCGYVAPAYYDRFGDRFLSSFTAGFLTTSGLQNVGAPGKDGEEEVPLHGSIANIPTTHSYWTEEEGRIVIHTLTRDEVMFGRKLTLERTLTVSTTEDVFTIADKVTNTNDHDESVQILYHMNMGYPLLDEDSVITIPSSKVEGRTELAQSELGEWSKMEKPTAGYQERCYYHYFADGKGLASIYQPKLKIKLQMEYDAKLLDTFLEWKMMGQREYVLGLEPGNCLLDGRGVLRQKGQLKFLKPGESKTYGVTIRLS
ncbi:MAG: aldose 1-epimerase family protein [Succinivibrio sp.]|nr:aldose 1-epimerase family protein [Succinivibrio sp.]